MLRTRATYQAASVTPRRRSGKRSPLACTSHFHSRASTGGTIAYIAENTVPKSLDTIGISEPVLAVLELPAGTTRSKQIRPGDTVYHRLFNNAAEEDAPSP